MWFLLVKFTRFVPVMTCCNVYTCIYWSHIDGTNKRLISCITTFSVTPRPSCCFTTVLTLRLVQGYVSVVIVLQRQEVPCSMTWHIPPLPTTRMLIIQKDAVCVERFCRPKTNRVLLDGQHKEVLEFMFGWLEGGKSLLTRNGLYPRHLARFWCVTLSAYSSIRG